MPAKNEAKRIAGALDAIDVAASRARWRASLLVLANNCHDGTADLANERARLLSNVDVSVRQVSLPPSAAFAGPARRLAVQCAVQEFRANDNDVIFSSDADAKLDPECLVRVRAALAGGADIVLAKHHFAPDPFDPSDEAAIELSQRKALWRHRVRELVETVRAGVRVPAHDDYGGAGIAARLSAYHRLGGFPPLEFNEDFHFVRAADEAGLTVDRQSGAVVHVSTRKTGRAVGGMAQDLTACATAVERGIACIVERHDATIRRILKYRSHARAFSECVSDWEPVDAATAGLERVLNLFEAGVPLEQDV